MFWALCSQIRLQCVDFKTSHRSRHDEALVIGSGCYIYIFVFIIVMPSSLVSFDRHSPSKDSLSAEVCENRTLCYFTGIFYAAVRQISMLFIDNTDSVFGNTTCPRREKSEGSHKNRTNISCNITYNKENNNDDGANFYSAVYLPDKGEQLYRIMSNIQYNWLCQ